MPFTYLDEPQNKSKFTYLDESVKPQFASQAEADAGQAKAQKDLNTAKFNASPLAITSKAMNMMTDPAFNAALGNLPEIISKATTGKPFVDPESQMKWLTEPLGMAGGASGVAVGAVSKAMSRIPSIVEKGFGTLPFLQKAAAVGKSSAMGAASMATQLPTQDNLIDNAKQYAGQVASGAVLGPIAETGIKGVIGVKNAFKSTEDKLFDAYNYVFGVKGKIPQNLKTAKTDTIAKVKAIQDNTPNEMENPLTGETFTTPSNRYETSIAHTEAKKNIWKKVTDLSKGATEADAKINLSKVVSKSFRDTVKGFGTVASRSTKSATIESIKKQARLIMEQGDISPTQSEAFMKSLFDDIKAVRQSGQPVDYSMKDFYSNLQKNLGNETDNVISNTLEKMGYKDARREYAIAKSSEKEILAAANKFLREHGQYQGIAHPITNIWALNDVLHSAITGNPSGIVRGITVKTASKLLDYMRNPDNKVRMIFDLAKKLPSAKVADYVKPVEAELMGTGRIGYSRVGLPNKMYEQSGPQIDMENPIKGLPDKSIQMGNTSRTGVNRPWENTALPSPRKAGQSSGPVIKNKNEQLSLPSPKKRPIPSRPKTPDVISGENPVKKLPKPDTVYGDNFTMKLSPKKGTVISYAEAGKNPLDEQKVGLESDPFVLKDQKEKAKFLERQAVEARQEARAFIKDIKGKLSNAHITKGGNLYGEFEPLRNDKKLFSPTGLQADKIITEIARKHPMMFDKPIEDLRGEDLIVAYQKALKTVGRVIPKTKIMKRTIG